MNGLSCMNDLSCMKGLSCMNDLSCMGIPYFRDWKPGRFRTTNLIRKMWFISYLEHAAILDSCSWGTNKN